MKNERIFYVVCDTDKLKTIKSFKTLEEMKYDPKALRDKTLNDLKKENKNESI